jgi:hypothetical protein
MSDDVSRYPLAWPVSWPRTSLRLYAHFGTRKTGDYKRPMTMAVAIGRLIEEADRLGAKDQVLSTNVALRLDGLPRAGEKEPSDPGAAFYFKLKGKPRVLACDRWRTVPDNVAAIAAHIAAIRAVDRYGVGSLDQAFAGYAALPPTSADWAIVLKVSPSATEEQIEDAFRKLARTAHPDVGGSHGDMARLNEARDAALSAIRVR